MKILILGHRKQKLLNYDVENWIKPAIDESIQYWLEKGMGTGLTGMASGVDLYFCQSCMKANLPYIACPPFEEQSSTMSIEDAILRKELIRAASAVWKIKNSQMVEICDGGIVVWDGNKGGTHNVFQQLLEKKKPFIWLNPVGEKIWYCF